MAQASESAKVSGPPSGAEFLRWLDGFVDEFNNVHDEGPKDDPLYCHWPKWWRNFKYECDDFNSAMFLMLSFCDHWELDPKHTPAYRRLMDEGLALSQTLEKSPDHKGYWQDQRDRVAKALDLDPECPLAATRAIVKSDLWFRVALMLNPTLPPPLPAWPQALYEALLKAKARFKPSEYWGHDEFTDSTWALRQIPSALAAIGWFDLDQAAENAALQATLETAKRAGVAPMRIDQGPQQGVKGWLFDPVKWRWVRHADIHVNFLAWDRRNLVISMMEGWTEDQLTKAADTAWFQKVVLPPMPEGD